MPFVPDPDNPGLYLFVESTGANMPQMATAEQLAQFGQFSQAKIDAAVAAIRARSGWHIAPELTDMAWLDSDGATMLRLPSLHVTGVTSVQDKDGNEITGWSWSAHGMLQRAAGFPVGFRAVRVLYTHGYSPVPADLLAAIAAETSWRVKRESLGARSVDLDLDGMSGPGSSLSAYRLGPRP